MIHRRKGRKLKRTASHRKALLSNLSASLILHKKIKTTLAKAKELRTYVEPIITKSRRALKSSNAGENVHLRREANKLLQNKLAIKTLFDEIAPKVIDRNGGYTRVLKLGRRLGDGAEMALIELVDYNIEKLDTKSEQKSTEDKDNLESADDKKTRKKKKTESKTVKSADKKATTKKSGKKKKETAE